MNAVSWTIKAVAILMIVTGLAALLTPFTPGSWLVPIGMVVLFGHDKTKKILVYIFGEQLYKKLKLRLFLRDKKDI